MALVLAVDPDRRQGKALDRLTTDLEGHEVVVASSVDEAVALINHRMPDLVLFPLLLTPTDEAALTMRLRSLGSSDAVYTLTIPLLASEESEAIAYVEEKPRWFYWFRPREESPSVPHCEPRVFAEEIRSYLEKARASGHAPHESQTRVDGHKENNAIPPVAGATETVDLGLTAVSDGATQSFDDETAVIEDTPRSHVPTGNFLNLNGTETGGAALSSENQARAVWSVRPLLARIGTAVLAGARRGTKLTGRAFAAVWPYVNLAARLRIAGSRRVWYAATSLVVSAGIVIATGMPSRFKLFAAPTMGVAAIESSPPGSEVFVDGAKVGVTPLTAQFAEGYHDAEFRFRGQTRTLSFQIAAGQSTLLRVDWKKTTGAGRRNAKIRS